MYGPQRRVTEIYQCRVQKAGGLGEVSTPPDLDSRLNITHMLLQLMVNENLTSER